VLRYEAFTTLAELSMQVPIMRELAATRDQSEFGLATSEDDRQQREHLHSSLRDADWGAWSSTTRTGEIGVGDYKGRLLYSSGNKDAFGGDLLKIAAAADAFRRDGPGLGAQVLSGESRELLESGLAREPRRGLFVVFARASVLAGVPQALFVQTIGGKEFLDQAAARGEAELALIAPSGAIEGTLPGAVVEAGLAAKGAMIETDHEGTPWLVQSHLVPSIEPDAAPIATLVVGREALVGLAGLFGSARAVLLWTALAAACALIGAVADIRRNSTH
jgi:hypothetical protein